MQLKIQVVIETETNQGKHQLVEEVACVERTELLPQTLGLKLEEAKEIVAAVQKVMTAQQVEEYLAQHSHCPACEVEFVHKDNQPLVWRSLFGKLSMKSPRYFSCACQGTPTTKTFRPLAQLLPERTSPEFLYLQSKWSALMSYGLTASLLQEVLPLDQPVQTSTLRQSVQKVAERNESELGQEETSFIEGCPAQWSELPTPPPPLVVGLDGGYVHAREGQNRKAGWFEVIVGKSIPTQTEGENEPASEPNKVSPRAKCFGFVNNYDKKPKRRLYELLCSQGMQNNQEVTFLSDGGDTVRQMQFYLNPQATFILDWFHVTMRLTVLGQYLKGLPAETTGAASTEPAVAEAKRANLQLVEQVDEAEEWEEEEEEEEEMSYPATSEITQELERIKWYLWHGNAHKALQLLGDLEFDLEGAELDQGKKASAYLKVFKAVREFNGYIRANQSYIVNYGDRYRNGETISSSIAEATVNQVVSKRFVKKQQQRWTKKGVHLLLQVRTQVLNEELAQTFQRWYPGFKALPITTSATKELAA
jgi:hypothetical protein